MAVLPPVVRPDKGQLGQWQCHSLVAVARKFQTALVVHQSLWCHQERMVRN